MQWFRLYAEMIDDPKVGTLSDAEFRTWIELLCVTCLENIDGDTGLTVDELSWKLRRNVTETLHTLLHRNLVTFIAHKNGVETVAITHWNKRQFKSDHVSERVRKFREKQRITDCNVTETLPKRYCNGADTDTDTDTDTEQKEHSTPLPPTPKNACPISKIIGLYHDTLPGLATVQKISNELARKIKARWNADTDRQSLEWWQWYFEGVYKCGFLMGQKKDWAATLHWLTGRENMEKVLSGYYLDRNRTTTAIEEFINEPV